MYEMHEGEATLNVVPAFRTLVMEGGGTMIFSEDVKRDLLTIARRAIESELGFAHREPPRDPAVKARCGVFVTLRRDAELRGCIGYIDARSPLQDAVAEVACKAAFEDPRFPPVSAHELSGLSIEISVLSPLERLKSPADLEVGKHGLVIEQGMRRGLLLPHVATEFGWDAEEFLCHTALKAGLPADAWQSSDVTISCFTTDTFSETELFQPQ